MLPQNGNTDVMIEMDQIVMFCLMTRRRINLVRLILNFILAAVNAERRRHTTLLYDIFLTRVFIKAQLPFDGHRLDNKRFTTMIKTFSALGLKPQAKEKEKEKEKDKKKKDSSIKKASAQKEKSKPFREGKKKKRKERSLSPILEERRTSKRRAMKLAEESSSSSRVEDEVSTIGAEPINLAEPTVQPATQGARLAQRGIMIRKLVPQKEPAQEEVSEGKGKKKLKKALAVPSRESTPFPMRRACREAKENKLREVAWLRDKEMWLLELELQNPEALLSLRRWNNNL